MLLNSYKSLSRRRRARLFRNYCWSWVAVAFCVSLFDGVFHSGKQQKAYFVKNVSLGANITPSFRKLRFWICVEKGLFQSFYSRVNWFKVYTAESGCIL